MAILRAMQKHTCILLQQFAIYLQYMQIFQGFYAKDDKISKTSLTNWFRLFFNNVKYQADKTIYGSCLLYILISLWVLQTLSAYQNLLFIFLDVFKRYGAS